MSGNKDEAFVARLKKVQALAVHISKEVSRLINDLRPTLLDTLGLVPAIRQYAETTLHPIGTRTTLEVEGNTALLSPEVEVGLFRVAQGAIGNIAKHSQAKNATIHIERKENQLILCVTDDGKGFNVSEITGIEDSGRGRGVFSMKERVKMLGGSCWIKSEPGQGTIVTATVPVIRSEPNGEDKSSSNR